MNERKYTVELTAGEILTAYSALLNMARSYDDPAAMAASFVTMGYTKVTDTLMYFTTLSAEAQALAVKLRALVRFGTTFDGGKTP